jgi:hypothetical protein
MKKYAVSLDPLCVARLRDMARQTAAREGRDVTWVGLLRDAATRLVAHVILNESSVGGAR